MTRQAADRLTWRDQEYLVAGVRPCDPFHPSSVDLQAQAATTANNRGYVCRYSVEDAALYLSRLRLFHPDPPALNGVAPRCPFPDGPLHLYEDLALRLDFTGGLVVVDELVGLPHVVPRPWGYARVFELVFEGGKLVASTDFSGEVAALRKQLTSFEQEDGADDSAERSRRQSAIGWSFVDGYEQRPGFRS